MPRSAGRPRRCWTCAALARPNAGLGRAVMAASDGGVSGRRGARRGATDAAGPSWRGKTWARRPPRRWSGRRADADADRRGAAPPRRRVEAGRRDALRAKERTRAAAAPGPPRRDVFQAERSVVVDGGTSRRRLGDSSAGGDFRRGVLQRVAAERRRSEGRDAPRLDAVEARTSPPWGATRSSRARTRLWSTGGRGCPWWFTRSRGSGPVTRARGSPRGRRYRGGSWCSAPTARGCTSAGSSRDRRSLRQELWAPPSSRAIARSSCGRKRRGCPRRFSRWTSGPSPTTGTSSGSARGPGSRGAPGQEPVSPQAPRRRHRGANFGTDLFGERRSRNSPSTRCRRTEDRLGPEANGATDEIVPARAAAHGPENVFDALGKRRRRQPSPPRMSGCGRRTKRFPGRTW